MSRTLFKRYNFFISDQPEEAIQNALARSFSYQIPYVHLGTHPDSSPHHNADQSGDTRRIKNSDTMHVALDRGKNVEIPLDSFDGFHFLLQPSLERHFQKLISLHFKGLIIISRPSQCENLYAILVSDWYKNAGFATLLCCDSVQDEYHYIRPMVYEYPFDVQYLYWNRRLSNKIWLDKLDKSYLSTMKELYAEIHWYSRVQNFTIPMFHL